MPRTDADASAESADTTAADSAADGVAVRILAGDCTTHFEGGGARERVQRGRVICLVKPDDTVLVHDASGYRPVAWLTRPEALVVERDPLAVRARDGDQRLRVEVHDVHAHRGLPASAAGVPVAPCPDCAGARRSGTLVRTTAALACTACPRRHGLPSGARVLAGEEAADCDCGLPRMRVARGDAFDLCVDRDCEPLDAAVREAFDRAWGCPDCGADLRVLRRGGLLAGCARYPDCETAFAIPEGVVTGACDCGLPSFATGSGRRCLDAACEAAEGS